MRTCPRCQGLVKPDLGNEYSCLICGWSGVTRPAPKLDRSASKYDRGLYASNVRTVTVFYTVKRVGRPAHGIDRPAATVPVTITYEPSSSTRARTAHALHAQSPFPLPSALSDRPKQLRKQFFIATGLKLLDFDHLLLVLAGDHVNNHHKLDRLPASPLGDSKLHSSHSKQESA